MASQRSQIFISRCTVLRPCCGRVSSVNPGMSELRQIRLPLRSSSHIYSFPLPRFPLWVIPDTFFPFTLSQPFLLLQLMNVFNAAVMPKRRPETSVTVPVYMINQCEIG